jgi:hypothetical protein
MAAQRANDVAALMQLGDWSAVDPTHIHPKNPKRKIFFPELFKGAKDGCPWCRILKAAALWLDSSASAASPAGVILWWNPNIDLFRPFCRVTLRTNSDLLLFTGLGRTHQAYVQ